MPVQYLMPPEKEAIIGGLMKGTVEVNWTFQKIISLKK